MARPNFFNHSKLIPRLVGTIIGAIGLAGLIFWGVTHWLPQPLNLPTGKVFAAQIRILTPGPYRIGDPIQFTVEARAVKGVDFRLPDLPKTALAKVELTSKTGPLPLRPYGGGGKMIRYTVTSWQTGQWQIPALQVPYWTATGKKAQYTIPARTLVIGSVLPKNRSQAELLALKLKPAKDPVSLPPNYQPLWLVLAGGTVLALIFGAGMLWRKHFPAKSATPALPPVILEPAHQIAFRRLEALRGQDYLTQGLFKEYYTELSECLREYIENRFAINALEMTTEEFLVWLAGNPVLAAAGRQILQQFLQTSDLVKFAQGIPDQTAASESWQQIYQLIEQTRSRPEQPDATPAITATA